MKVPPLHICLVREAGYLVLPKEGEDFVWAVDYLAGCP